MNRDMAIELAAEGHVVHRQRNSYTHAAFARDLDKDIEIQDKGKRVWNRFLGRYVKIGDLLPERAILGLDDDGNILSQVDFEVNYRLYLAAFPTNRDPGLEPVPNVLRFLLVQVDQTFPEGDGRYVELGWTPTAEIHEEPEIPVEVPVVEMEYAACGKEVKPRGRHLHELRCGQPECVEARKSKDVN